MCKPEMTKGNVPVAVKAPLLSVDAYAVRPSLSSMLQTGFGILGFLFAVEFTLRLVIFNYQVSFVLPSFQNDNIFVFVVFFL